MFVLADVLYRQHFLNIELVNFNKVFYNIKFFNLVHIYEYSQ